MTSQTQTPDQNPEREETAAEAAARLADMLEGVSGDPETLVDGAPSISDEPELLDPQVEEPPEETAEAAALREAQAQLEAAQQQRDAAEEEARQMKNRALRAAADLDNFRRRAQKEKADLEKFAVEGLAKDLLEVVDNLERALTHHKPQSDEGAADPLFAGVEMVLKQFRQKLLKVGVEGFESQGLPFDPLRHEAIQQVESREHANGTVVTEFQRGYFLHGRLLRPALVVVANNPQAEAAPAQGDEAVGDEASGADEARDADGEA